MDSSPEFRQELQKRLSVSSDIDSYNICRIHVHTRTFDWTQPPNRNKGSQGTGTGFMLDIIPNTSKHAFIVTAHHVVANSVLIRVNFGKISSEYIEAKLVGCNADMDVAIIMVHDSDFLSSLKEYKNIGLRTGNSDEIRPPATVTAHGFALGNPQMQTTKGVVSARVDSPSRLQTDVAVNPGNSGGPLLDENNVVIGIVTSGRTDAQGINFVAPMTESAIIIRRIVEAWTKTELPVHDRMPCLNCSFTKSNRVLLDSIDTCNSGVYTTSVHPLVQCPQRGDIALQNLVRNLRSDDTTGPIAESRAILKKYPNLSEEVSSVLQKCDSLGIMTLFRWSILLSDHLSLTSEAKDALLILIQNDTLQEGDIVCNMIIEGREYDIDLQMTAKYDFWHDRVGFQSIFDRMSCSDEKNVHLKFFRRGKIQTVAMSLNPNMNEYRKMYADVDKVPYLVMAGVFVMPLMHNHIPMFNREPLYTLLTRPDTRHSSILVITHILPESPFNECESIGVGDVLISINNEMVLTIDDANRVWTSCTSSNCLVVTLRMRDGSLATASQTQIRDSSQRIIEQYNSNEYVGFHISHPSHLVQTSPAGSQKINKVALTTSEAPTLSSSPLEAPTRPSSPLEAPTRPSSPLEAPTRPSSPLEAPTRPSSPLEAPTRPTSPLEAPTRPTSPLEAHSPGVNVKADEKQVRRDFRPLSYDEYIRPVDIAEEMSVSDDAEEENERLSDDADTVRREISDEEEDDRSSSAYSRPHADDRDRSRSSSSDSSLSSIVDEVKTLRSRLNAMRGDR
jgi:hypothetical protein